MINFLKNISSFCTIMKTIRLELPDDLNKGLQSIADNIENFIVTAIKEKLEKDKKKQFKKNIFFY